MLSKQKLRECQLKLMNSNSEFIISIVTKRNSKSRPKILQENTMTKKQNLQIKIIDKFYNILKLNKVKYKLNQLLDHFIKCFQVPQLTIID